MQKKNINYRLVIIYYNHNNFKYLEKHSMTIIGTHYTFTDREYGNF